MPRQRKAQNGAVRTPMSTGRVANTTTSTPKLQTVYRIPVGKGWDCCKVNWFEILWTSPVKVHIEWEDIYRVYLDEEALETLIENMHLDLGQVSITEVEWEVTFSGKINASEFEWAVVNADTLNADTLNADTGTITDLTATTSDLWAATADSLTTDSLTVTTDTTFPGSVTVNGTLSASTGNIATLTSTDATITNLTATNWTVTALSSDNATLWQLSVTGTSTFTGAINAGDIHSTGNASLTNLNVTGSSLLNWATVNGNIAVNWNQTITWNSTFSGPVTMSDDLTVVDDLTVQWTTHLNALETTGSVDVDWTLRVDWAINGGNGMTITGQIESDTIRTTEVVTDELRVTEWLYLSQWAEAPDFILQAEKGEPNGVTPLDANGKVDPQYLPASYTSAIVKIGTGTFSNSDTSTVIDADITWNSFVAISNYQDIVWDLTETINPWELVVISNHVETGSYKYIVVNPLPAC